jgi:hypothetical protein
MKYIFLVVALLSSAGVFAGTALDKQAYQLSFSSDTIPVQREIIEKKISQVEYTELSSENRKSLLTHLEHLASAQLTESDALTLQKSVNDILLKAFSDSKIICKYESPLGTNMRIRSCMTLAAKNRAYEKTQLDLQTNSGVQRTN